MSNKWEKENEKKEKKKKKEENLLFLNRYKRKSLYSQ